MGAGSCAATGLLVLSHVAQPGARSSPRSPPLHFSRPADARVVALGAVTGRSSQDPRDVLDGAAVPGLEDCVEGRCFGRGDPIYGGLEKVTEACDLDADCKGIEYATKGENNDLGPYGRKCGRHGKRFRIRRDQGKAFGFVACDYQDRYKDVKFHCAAKYCVQQDFDHGMDWEWGRADDSGYMDPAHCKLQCLELPGCSGIAFHRATSWCLYWFTGSCNVLKEDESQALMDSNFSDPHTNIVTCSLPDALTKPTTSSTTSTTTPHAKHAVYCGNRRTAKDCDSCRQSGEFMWNWCRGQCLLVDLPNYEGCVLATFCDASTKAVSCSHCPRGTCSAMCRRSPDGERCEERPKRWTKGDCLCRWRWQKKTMHANEPQCTSSCCNLDNDKQGEWCAVDNSTDVKCSKEWDYCKEEGYQPAWINSDDDAPIWTWNTTTSAAVSPTTDQATIHSDTATRSSSQTSTTSSTPAPVTTVAHSTARPAATTEEMRATTTPAPVEPHFVAIGATASAIAAMGIGLSYLAMTATPCKPRQ